MLLSMTNYYSASRILGAWAKINGRRQHFLYLIGGRHDRLSMKLAMFFTLVRIPYCLQFDTFICTYGSGLTHNAGPRCWQQLMVVLLICNVGPRRWQCKDGNIFSACRTFNIANRVYREGNPNSVLMLRYRYSDALQGLTCDAGPFCASMMACSGPDTGI